MSELKYIFVQDAQIPMSHFHSGLNNWSCFIDKENEKTKFFCVNFILNFRIFAGFMRAAFPTARRFLQKVCHHAFIVLFEESTALVSRLPKMTIEAERRRWYLFFHALLFTLNPISPRGRNIYNTPVWGNLPPLLAWPNTRHHGLNLEVRPPITEVIMDCCWGLSRTGFLVSFLLI